MPKDIYDGLDWLREIRRQIVTECHNDVKTLGDYYRNIQKQYETTMNVYSGLEDINGVSNTEWRERVSRHRTWQEGLDKETFFDEVFGKQE